MERRRRPIRGALAGLLLGLGATLMVMLYDLPVPGDVVLVGLVGLVVLGVPVGVLGPTRGPAEPPGT
jgi:hypothetical protein